MKRLLLGLGFAATMLAQAPFKATAELGKPARVGAIARVIGSNEELDSGLLREVTLESATLALAFPNSVENVVAAAHEKLLIMRGQLRNLSKRTNISIGASSAIGFRIWERYQGAGKFQFVNHFDPDTLKHLQKTLQAGEAGTFLGVWRLPADFTDFRFGITTERATIIPWYDLRPAMGKLSGVVASADGIGVNPSATVRAGSRFEMDGIEMVVSPPTGAAFTVLVRATNKMMLPVRWGWQYFTTELLGSSGAVKAYPEIIDRASGSAWAGDLAAGATVEAQFSFYPNGPYQATGFRLKVNATGRSVAVVF